MQLEMVIFLVGNGLLYQKEGFGGSRARPWLFLELAARSALGSLSCGVFWCRKTDLPREERKEMLSSGSGEEMECVGVCLIKGGS